MVWQTILVLKELEEVLGCPPMQLALLSQPNSDQYPTTIKTLVVKMRTSMTLSLYPMFLVYNN